MKFIADVHLAKLGRHLRMLGYDTFWEDQLQDDEILRLSQDENRKILTRDRQLHERAEARLGAGHSLLIRDDDPGLQLLQTLAFFELLEEARESKGFLTRCLQCNTLLLPAKPHQVTERVPGHLLTSHDQFFLCPRCERFYWEGSHVNRMRKWIRDLLSSS